MSIPKESHELIRQNEQNVRKSQKHDANLQKNSTLYFQIGLIVCLLTTYGLFEMEFQTTIQNYADLPPLEDPAYVDVPLIKPVEPTREEPIEQKQKKASQTFEEVPNDTPDLPFVDDPVDELSVDVNPPMDPDEMGNIEPPIEDEYSIIGVEQVPIYPGCEKKKTNDERRKCMSEKLAKLIRKKFNTDLGGELELSGKQVIQTQFKIDKTGNVINIKTRAVHPKLEEEAERVINKIPEMTPGKQSNKEVGVIYTLPIVFFVQN